MSPTAGRESTATEFISKNLQPPEPASGGEDLSKTILIQTVGHDIASKTHPPV
jgi:hypothetical protein